jgi:hypothetical protein
MRMKTPRRKRLTTHASKWGPKGPIGPQKGGGRLAFFAPPRTGKRDSPAQKLLPRGKVELGLSCQVFSPIEKLRLKTDRAARRGDQIKWAAHRSAETLLVEQSSQSTVHLAPSALAGPGPATMSTTVPECSP